MELRHSRNIPALSREEQALLAGKTLAVIGCGGLGGYLIELLCRVGVGTIRAVDGDVFEQSNLNRQLLSTMDTLGTPKAQAAAERVKAIDPGIRVEARCVYLDEHNARELVAGCDAVVDALDSIAARRTLAKACEMLQIPLVFGGISGWVVQAAVSMPGDHLIETLFPESIELKDRSVLSFTPALCAAMQASLCVRLLAGRPVKTGSISCFDLLNQEFETIDLV